jgi:NADH/NAD ratio-sensing transcriptional regulator Rex
LTIRNNYVIVVDNRQHYEHQIYHVKVQRVKRLEAITDQKAPATGDRMKRLYALARQLRDKGTLDIPSVTEQFGTTSRTIRRDLDLLEEYGWITSSGTTQNKKYFLSKQGWDKVNALP